MQQTKTKSFGAVLRILALTTLLLISFLGFFAAAWYVRVYGRIGFDSILYTLTASLGGVDSGLIQDFSIGAALPAAVCAIAASLLLFWPGQVRVCGKKLLPLKKATATTISLLLSLCLLIHGAFNSQLVEYVVSAFSESELYETEYKDPASVQITFPEEKRNLIYIMLESMETSYQDTSLGGALEYNLIPELTALAQNNINFSHNDTVGGFREVTGTSWTVGAMVGHTAGVPLKVPNGIDDWQNGYGKDGEFLPGLNSLTGILKEQGYYQALMVGSDARFGGRKTYFETHGIDKVYDLYTAWYDGTVKTGYWNDWWGFEDEILFEYAKKELTKMAAGDQPFAFTMLTVDTHHIGGYTCKLCGSNYEESYENAIACSSRQVEQFVAWIMEQDFYENTTVIITGDHCSMDKGYFSRNVDENYTRHVYNCFINAAATPLQTKNRQFSALDMFPTTLAAMGCKIQGDRLGLGTNLFSALPTLIERFGYETLCKELSKQSVFYEDSFYGEIDYSTTPTE
jgi:phosphoglycerol transferase